MLNVWEHRLCMALLFWISCAYLSACANDSLSQDPAYAADMLVRVDNIQTSRRIWTRNGRLRLALPAGYDCSTLLVDYRSGHGWAVSPDLNRYCEIPVSNLLSSIPNFFDPTLTLEKTLVDQKALDGEMVRIYTVTARSAPEQTWQGTLWEAESLPGYPLKWHDASRNIEAQWLNAALVEVSDAFFNVPDHYTLQQGTSSSTLQQHCRAPEHALCKSRH